jgi:hypothetical protein
MPKSRKMILLGGIFIGISFVLMGTFMFPSVDKFKASSENFEGLQSQQASALKEKESIILKNAYKTEKSLIKQKTDILADIDKMLKNNKNSNYIPSEDVSKLIESIVGNVGQVKIIAFRNIPNADSSPSNGANNSVLIKHNFNIKIQGSFQGVYDVLTSLEKIKGINISTVEVEKSKEDNGVSANFNFYVVNTNKNILNF